MKEVFIVIREFILEDCERIVSSIKGVFPSHQIIYSVKGVFPSLQMAKEFVESQPDFNGWEYRTWDEGYNLTRGDDAWWVVVKAKIKDVEDK